MTKQCSVQPGNIYTNKKGEKFKILSLEREERRTEGLKKPKIYRYFKIEFLETGYQTVKEKSTILKGDISDRLKNGIMNGIASFGYGETHPLHNPKLYRIYFDILRRCYDKNCRSYKSHGAKGVTVCDRWKRYDYFLDDIQEIDGFDLEKILKGQLHLDKDKLQQDVPINKRIYSKETCCYITPKENTLISMMQNKKRFVKGTSPDGEEIIITNVREFCRNSGIKESYIYNSLNRNNSRKENGWNFEYVDRK